MENDYTFLPHFITEDIYVLKNERTFTQTSNNIPLEIMDGEAHGKGSDAEKEEDEEIFFKGKNLKQIAILVDYKNKGFMSSSDESFLIKILGALKLSAEDVAIINVNHLSSVKQLQKFEYQKMICFGCEVEIMISDWKMYDVQKEGGKVYLKADHLEQIQNDKEKKARLWEGLQIMFGIKK